jgi:hypothetical protein
METAMKASKKINTAPASGSTMGISGTTASTASGRAASGWCAGADMGKTLKKVIGSDSSFPHHSGHAGGLFFNQVSTVWVDGASISKGDA